MQISARSLIIKKVIDFMESISVLSNQSQRPPKTIPFLIDNFLVVFRHYHATCPTQISSIDFLT